MTKASAVALAKRLIAGGVSASPAVSTVRCMRDKPRRGRGPELASIRIDTITGMAFSSLVSLAIVFATAATLNSHGFAGVFHPAAERAAPRHGPNDLPRPCPAGRCNRTAVPAVSSAAGSRRLHLQKLWTSIRPAFWPNATAPWPRALDFQGISMGWETPKPLPRPRSCLRR